MRDTFAELQAVYPWAGERPQLAEDWHGWLAPGTADTLTAAYAYKPKLIIECGTWLGMSARCHLQGCPDARLVCIDTWHGSPEHVAATAPQDWRDRLASLYVRCMTNLWPWKDRTILVPEDSFQGLSMAAVYEIVPDLIYLDSEHTPQRLFGELALCRKFWPHARVVLDDCNNPAVGDTVKMYCNFCLENLTQTSDCAWTIEPR